MMSTMIKAILERAHSAVIPGSGVPLPSVMGGKIQEVAGNVLRVSGISARIGQLCHITDEASKVDIMAEVIGLSGGVVLLTPLAPVSGLSVGAKVINHTHGHRVPVGPGLVGRVLNGFGEPIDGRGAIDASTFAEVDRSPPSPMQRAPVVSALATGVRCIDSLMTVGVGQRVGIFSPAGVGKSVLLSMIARGCDADVVVLALVGERGIEVRDFLEKRLGHAAMARCVTVVATSDTPAAERLKCALVATTIAEYFRDAGARTLFLMDSITRFARAQREIGLATGEPPTRRGFPPSVFSVLPRLLERTGPAERGAITAFYTILMEDAETADPIAEEVRSILDGHIVLSPRLAARGWLPAIDVLTSLSRSVHLTMQEPHRRAAQRVRALLAKYEEIEPLVQMGEFQRGRDADADEAVEKMDAIRTLLTQGNDEHESFERTLDRLTRLAQR